MQTNVDVIGIVKEVGAIGSIKRKTDGSDVARRDVTIVDKRCGCSYGLRVSKP